MQLEARRGDFAAGALNRDYFARQVGKAGQAVARAEVDSAPAGWTCVWDEPRSRYTYFNKVRCARRYTVLGMERFCAHVWAAVRIAAASYWLYSARWTQLPCVASQATGEQSDSLPGSRSPAPPPPPPEDSPPPPPPPPREDSPPPPPPPDRMRLVGVSPLGHASRYSRPLPYSHYPPVGAEY
jgi:hypothetical protein